MKNNKLKKYQRDEAKKLIIMINLVKVVAKCNLKLIQKFYYYNNKTKKNKVIQIYLNK